MPSAPTIEQRAARGAAWIALASSIIAVLDVVALAVILSHWITPDQYGTAALAVTLFPILDLATDLGLASAVVQRDDVTDDRLSTVYWLNLGGAIALFGVLLVVGPLLGEAQGAPVAGTMMIVYGTKVIWQALVFNVPQALMRRELRYKELSVIRVLANVVDLSSRVALAASGAGIWCFVIAPLCRTVVTGVGIQLRRPWKPGFVLRLADGAAYVRFGIKTSASQLLFHFYTNVDYQVVGWFFGPRALGLYRAAYDLILEPVRLMSNVVVEIAFPVFARLKHERARLIDQFILFTRQNLVVVVPYLAIVLLAAEQAITVFFGAEWAEAATAARVLCVVGAFRALSFVVPPLLDGVGFPQLTLVYTATASVLLPALYVGGAALLGPRLGYLSVAIAWAVGYPIAFAVLARLALGKMQLSGRVYLTRVAGIPRCVAIAMVWGLVMRWLTRPLVAGAQLALIAAITTLALGVLLAYLEGVSPRSVARALKD